MKALLTVVALMAGFAAPSFAGELDNDTAVANQKIQGTIVVRVDNRTKEVAALQTSALMANETEAKALVDGKFEAVSAKNVRSELDQDGGASSWYFYNGCGYYNNCGYGYNYGYNYGYMNWYGNWYQPCYNYSYGYYSYYYYSSGWSWRRW